MRVGILMLRLVPWETETSLSASGDSVRRQAKSGGLTRKWFDFEYIDCELSFQK